MTVELYPQHTINRNGWATATEIEAAANLFAIWFKYKYLATTVFTLYFKFIQCKLSYLHWHTSFTKSFLTIKMGPSQYRQFFDILKNQLKRQGQQNKISNNKKRKLSTKITLHLEEGNRQTEQESEKQC